MTVPTPIDGARRPDLGAILSASDTVGKVLKRGDIVVYESTVYPGTIEEECLPVLRKGVGACGGPRFHSRLFARADQSGRSATSLRNHHQSGFGAGCAHARYRRRCLRLGGEGRHPSRAIDQGRGSRQGHREYAARSQYRLHERTFRHFSSARDRHRRCPRRCRRPNGTS